MAIVRFTTLRSEVPADAVNVRDISATYDQGTIGPRTLWAWDTHVGLCVADREMNGSWDSDFYMTVWNPETKQPSEILYASTRGWTYPSMASSVDATDAVRAEYDAWLEARRAEQRAAWQAKENATPRRGKTVRVVKGRKVPVGTEGVVGWTSDDNARLGIDPNGDRRQRVFTAASNVVVVEGR